MNEAPIANPQQIAETNYFEYKIFLNEIEYKIYINLIEEKIEIICFEDGNNKFQYQNIYTKNQFQKLHKYFLSGDIDEKDDKVICCICTGRWCVRWVRQTRICQGGGFC